MCRIPDEEAGEIPAACVVLKRDCFISPAEIQAFVASKVIIISHSTHKFGNTLPVLFKGFGNLQKYY